MWSYKKETKELFFDGYHVDMEEFVRDSVDWFQHLKTKVWFTFEVELEFLRAALEVVKKDPSLGRVLRKHAPPVLFGDFTF